MLLQLPILLRAECQCQRRSDLVGNRSLHGEQIMITIVETVGPKRGTICHADQSDIDANSVVNSLNAAIQNRVRLQFSSGSQRILLEIVELANGAGGTNHNFLERSQSRDESICHAQ